MKPLSLSLEQWVVFTTIVQEGGYLAAAKALNKTQPSLTYQIKKMEEILQARLFYSKGRNVHLTDSGRSLYRYANRLVAIARETETIAKGESIQRELTLRLAVDEIYPPSKLMWALQAFEKRHPQVKLILRRGVLDQPRRWLERKEVDIAIVYKPPTSVISVPILTTYSQIYAHASHALHQLRREITETDLLRERQIIISDFENQDAVSVGWLSSGKVWLVDSLEMKLEMLEHGFGFAWINRNYVEQRAGNLRPLPLLSGGERPHTLYLAHYNDCVGKEAIQSLLACLQTKPSE